MTGPKRAGRSPRAAPSEKSPGHGHSSAGQSRDTICAVATPPGTGGLAVVRVSGNGTFSILDRFFAERKPSRQRPNTVRLNWFVSHTRQPLDNVLVTVFRSPRSYTGEDMVEVSCHGGTVAADAVMNLLVRSGCRVAEPGEFTRRAVLAGKMTLSQAEAVADMTEARTEAAFRGALGRYRGELSLLVADLTGELKDLLTELEFRLGFDEQDDCCTAPRTRIRRIEKRLAKVVESAAGGRFLIEGANIAIIGRPNAGKSSLFNLLVEGERAITSPYAGTTRDRVDATIVLAGVPIRFVDTAGLTGRGGARLNRLAVAQTNKAVEQADVIIALFDGSRPAGPSDHAVLATCGSRPTICALNKTDLPRRFEDSHALPGSTRLTPISCRTGAGIASLRTRITRALRTGPGPRLAVNRRQLETLSACRDALARAGSARTLETAALETRSAIDMLSQVDAPVTSTDILDRVFARFCVGK